jgi:hypothetical protein
MSVESDEHSERPSTRRKELVTDKVRFAVLDNQRITIRELSDELGLSFGLVHYTLTEDLGMKRILTKSVPNMLTVESHLAQNFLVKQQTPKVPQKHPPPPPHSLDMAPCDFLFLFPDMKMLLQ